MMSYESFRDRVVDHFLNYMPGEYSDYEVCLRRVRKTNEEKDGIMVVRKEILNKVLDLFNKKDSRLPQVDCCKGNIPGSGGISSESAASAASEEKKELSEEDLEMMPIVYVEDLYRGYRDTKDFSNVMKRAAEGYASALEDRTFLRAAKSAAEDPTGKVVPVLINRARNEDLLKTMPYREFLDMAITYRNVYYDFKLGYYSINVTNDMMASENLTEQDLYDKSTANVQVLYPNYCDTVLNRLNSLHKGMRTVDVGVGGKSIDKADYQTLYIFSNSITLFGASIMIQDEPFADLAEKFGTDLFVIPSSIHELLVCSSKFVDPYALKNTIKEVNRMKSLVPDGDFLSDNLYLYRKDFHQMEIYEGGMAEGRTNGIAQ